MMAVGVQRLTTEPGHEGLRSAFGLGQQPEIHSSVEIGRRHNSRSSSPNAPKRPSPYRATEPPRLPERCVARFQLSAVTVSVKSCATDLIVPPPQPVIMAPTRVLPSSSSNMASLFSRRPCRRIRRAPSNGSRNNAKAKGANLLPMDGATSYGHCQQQFERSLLWFADHRRLQPLRG